MRSIIKYITSFIVCMIVGVLQVHAQIFPISINAQVNNPPPIYLNNYADATTINGPLNVQLLLSDLSINNRQLQLKVSVFEQIQIDLEAQGYKVLPFLLPACGIDA